MNWWRGRSKRLCKTPNKQACHVKTAVARGRQGASTAVPVMARGRRRREGQVISGIVGHLCLPGKRENLL
ncbi:hypothetical protein FJTKL_08961 [Diaporthe vaccinii]|uniref:Uncharacterized protein n=1 Tax=Diaporthe vaccinii TaxID=105482 RepID=A0ABR4DQ89_9PEZI